MECRYNWNFIVVPPIYVGICQEVLRADMHVLFQVSAQLNLMQADFKIPLIRRIALFGDIMHSYNRILGL